MAKRYYWLSDAEWARIEPLLPRGRKGARRVDDRRVISGIVHMLQVRGAMAGLPAGVMGRTRRSTIASIGGAGKGLWLRMFEALTGHSGIVDGAAIDATHVKAHRSAAGAKGGPSPRP